MGIDRIKNYLFEADRNVRTHPGLTRGLELEYQRRIKLLTQEQRQFVLDIFNQPNPQIPQAEIDKLYLVLNGSDKRYRKDGLRQKVSRIIKNWGNNRISSSQVMNQVSEAKLKFEEQLKLNTKKMSLNAKLKLLTTSPLEVNLLTTFLNDNREALSNFAFDHPKSWNAFSKKMQRKLLKDPINTSALTLSLEREKIARKKISDLLTLLNRKVNDHVRINFTLGPDIVTEMSNFLSKTEIEHSLYLIKSLSGGFNPAAIAQFIVKNQAPLPKLLLESEELQKVVEALGPQPIDLSPIGIGEGPSLPSTQTHLRLIGSSFEIKYLQLFKKIESLDISSIRDSKADLNFIKLFPGLKTIEYFDPSGISDADLQIFGSLPKLAHLHLASSNYWATFTAEGIAKLQKVRTLKLFDNKNIDLQSSLGSLLKLKHLYLYSSVAKSAQMFPPNLETLELAGDHTGPLPESLFNQIKSLKNLKNLTLMGARDFSDPVLQKQLKSLNLESFESFTSTTFSSTAPFLSNLKELSLPNIASFKITSPLPNLKVLRRPSFPTIDEVGFISNLEQFLFTGNQIANADLKPLHGLSQLKSLTFQLSTPTEEQLEILKKHPSLKRIVFPDRELSRNAQGWVTQMKQ